MTAATGTARAQRWLASLTVEQWRRIDEQILAPRTGTTTGTFDPLASGVLVAMALVLVLLRYLGLSDVVLEVAALRAWFDTLPYPGLWPKLYWAACRVLGYLVVPAWIIHRVFGARLRDYGLRIETSRRVLLLYFALFLIVVPLVYVASHNAAFVQKYPFYKGAANSWTELLLWESAYGLQFLALEFFFRGFALFALAKRFGANAIFIVMVPYTMIHFTKPLAETLGAIVAGIALGTLALRTRSIFGGVLVHTAVGWTMDLLALSQQGSLQRLLGK